MSFLDRLFGSKRKANEASRQDAGDSQPASAAGSHRELLRVVLRDTVAKHGIPPGWISAEVISGTGADTMHVRFHIRHWDPRLPVHAVAFQRSLLKRLEGIDPQSASWLTGFSWQFMLADESGCPAMPEPSAWLAPPQAVAAAPAEPAAVPLEDRKAALNRLLDGGSSEPPVVTKPIRLGTPPLPPAQPDFEATQPMPVRGFEDTQRMTLPLIPDKH